MADQAVKLKVDKNTYNETLESLRTQLNKLQDCREKLRTQIDELNRDGIFGASIAQGPKDKAEVMLKSVEGSIADVEAYKNAIQKQLEGTETEERNLESKLSNINIPNLFE